MEKYRGLIEDGTIFLVMSIFTALKQMVGEEGTIDWTRTITKVFINFIAGIGLYSFLISYKPWANEYPHKIGVIMFVVYAGSRIIDIVVDKLLNWLRKVDLKKLLNL